MTDWNTQLKTEFERARQARVEKNEGKARVCARRAAGIAARAYLTRKGIQVPNMSAYDLLNLLRENLELPPEKHLIAEHLTMRVNEEVDALETMGLRPVEFLVLPRVLATALMMPALVAYADLLGLLGGLFVGTTVLDLGTGCGIQSLHAGRHARRVVATDISARALERARTLMERVGLAQRADSFPHQLSGGEKQRVALCRALINRPRILFADEPTGNLDSENGRVVLDLLREFHREMGVTLVLVTHNAAIAQTAGRIVRLRDGRVVGEERHAP